jgi:transcriptional regulator GlxA family with amidase domain
MDERIQHVISFLERDSSRKMRLDGLSRMVNLSPWRLCHLFKQETGMSLIRFVHTLRMKEAKILLEGTFLTIKEIRVKVGFLEESHFIRTFERAYHLSPSEYRRQYWNTQRCKQVFTRSKSKIQQDQHPNSKIG